MKRIRNFFITFVIMLSFICNVITYAAQYIPNGYMPDGYIPERKSQNSSTYLKSDSYTIRFVSSDITNYPRVKLYYKIYDSNGRVVNDYTIREVILWEKISGGEYLQREVRSHELLSERSGLSTGLAIDKSGSMDADSIRKIKSVLKQFANTMNFNVGDEAELLVFDTNIDTLTYFTNSLDSLLDAINRINKGKGKTALYDALYEAIKDAKDQQGARCIIGFTDGIDNMSSETVESISRYAKRYQVPVYIVGAGKKLKDTELKNIAKYTGGKYWNIDDLEDFYAILRDIYIEEKNSLYIEYITDPFIGSDVPRDIKVIIDDVNNSIVSEDNVQFVVRDPSKDLTNSLKEKPPESAGWYKTKSGLWYYFMEDRVTKATGWIVDNNDNQTYYLDPQTGIMSVGWTNIDGFWYYFNELFSNEPNWYEVGNGFYESYGKKIKAYGSMYRDEITPDGKYVDAFGRLVE